ncbi:MAG: hypothetical protein RL632_495 [Bacteroidota bacterium]|jgi:1-acyl-sn-glycerol-3-phosphate acyltransferase
MYKTVIRIYKLTAAFVIICIMGVVAFPLRVVSLGTLTNFNRKYLVAGLSRLALFLIGIRLDNRFKQQLPDTPHLITFNHNSFLDGFVLFALRLTNTRFINSRRMMWLLPISVPGALSVGTLYIPPKYHPKQRLRFFKRTEKRILREQVHIAASSEGSHRHVHDICAFNRGIYHMALNCQMPIVALFIDTPPESNPFSDYRYFQKGTVRVELLDIIPTTDWKLETLDEHVAFVREKFVKRFHEIEKENGR